MDHDDDFTIAVVDSESGALLWPEPISPAREPGRVLGWVIYFGARGEHQAWCPVELGETIALLRASKLERGQIVRVVVG